VKTLYIIRHAKSSWEHPLQDDFDRPLNQRGEKDAPEMGRRLAALQIKPDLIISSPALRAITTARIITGLMGFRDIVELPEMYHASDRKLLEIINALPDTSQTVILFGHNRGLTDLVNNLSGTHVPNVPTCGVSGISFNLGTWKEVSFGKGKLFLFDFPKSKNAPA